MQFERIMEPEHFMPKTEMAPVANQYKPIYSNPEALEDVQLRLQQIEPVTNIGYINQMSADLAEVKKSARPYIIAGRCTNLVNDLVPVCQHIDESQLMYTSILEVFDNAVIALRDARGGSAKRRTNPFEEVEGYGLIVPYRGDTINGIDPAEREPNPELMVKTAIQARDIEKGLQRSTGRHIYATHEAFLLPYEQSFIKERNGKAYLGSGDTVWVGVGTNDTDGEYIDLLEMIENPVAVKIGPTASAIDIRELAEKLDHGQKAGRLNFMLRLGIRFIESNPEKLTELLGAIRRYAPAALTTNDPVHGNTIRTEDGTKTRLVDHIIEEIKVVSSTCRDLGMKLNGIHLEAMADNTRKECIDHLGEIPDKSLVDPNLNLSQLRRVLRAAKPYL